jgi:hypothetical protein
MTQPVPGRAGSTRTKKISFVSLGAAAATFISAAAALWVKDPELAAKIGATGVAFVTLLNTVAPMWAHDDAVATAAQAGGEQAKQAENAAVVRAGVMDDAQETRITDAVAASAPQVVVVNEAER